MSCIEMFNNCLSMFGFAIDTSSKRQEGVKEQARAVSRIAQNGKREGYYITLKNLIEAADKISLPTDELELSEDICSDALIFKNIIKYKKEEARDSLESEIKEALRKGIPAKVLQSLVGPGVNVESLTEKSATEKFEQYIEVLSTDCSICCEKFSPADFVAKRIHRMSCHHFYHTECIVKAMSYKDECPVCRKELSLDAFKKEQEVWKQYLESIHGEIEKRFPEVQEKERDPSEELALQFHAEEMAGVERERAKVADIARLIEAAEVAHEREDAELRLIREFYS